MGEAFGQLRDHFERSHAREALDSGEVLLEDRGVARTQQEGTDSRSGTPASLRAERTETMRDCSCAISASTLSSISLWAETG